MFRNTLAQAARLFTSQGYSFLLAPIMVNRLGLTLFGVWTVVGAIAAYASVLDAGIIRALARFVAMHDANGDQQAIRECVGLGMIAFTGIGLVLLPLAWFAAPPVADALGHVTGSQMRQILVAMAAIFTVQGYSAVFQALSHGLRRMVEPNIAVMLGNTVNFGASVGTLLLSRSLVPYAWANAGAETVSALLVLVAARHVWRTRMAAWPSLGHVREILGFSVKSQLAWIADLINLQTDLVVIGFLVGPKGAAVYTIGSSVAGAIHSVGAISVSALIPTATAAITVEGRNAVRRLALHYLPRTLSVTFPIFALTGLTAPFLFGAWIHERAAGAVPILIALNVAYAINIATAVPSTLSIADGRPGFLARNSLWMAAVNVVLTIALAPLFGLSGVVAGTAVAVGTLSIVFVAQFSRSYGITADELRAMITPSAVLSLAVAVPFVPVVVETRHMDGSRVSSAVVLIAVAAAYGVVYWPIASVTGMLPQRLLLRRVRRAPAVVLPTRERVATPADVEAQ